MAFKELCFGIVVLFIATSIIGEVQAQALNGESSEQVILLCMLIKYEQVLLLQFYKTIRISQGGPISVQYYKNFLYYGPLNRIC